MNLFKHIFFLVLALFVSTSVVQGQESIREMEIKNVDGHVLKLDSFYQHKALVIVFSSNHCVYSKKYEKRLMALANEYMPQGIGFVMIDSNDPSLSAEDSFENMQTHATEMGYNFPFLHDATQEFAQMMGAEKNPEAFVLKPGESDFEEIYHGPIDDNPLLPSGVKKKFLAEFLDAFLAGEAVDADVNTRITGCKIRWNQ